MLFQRLTGALAAVIVAAVITIPAAQADYQRHTDPTVAIIAGTAIVTATYLAYQHSHYKAKPHYGARYYKHGKHYQKRHDYADYTHKRKYAQRHRYDGYYSAYRYRDHRYDRHHGDRYYSPKKRYHHNGDRHYRYKKRHYRH